MRLLSVTHTHSDGCLINCHSTCHPALYAFVTRLMIDSVTGDIFTGLTRLMGNQTVNLTKKTLWGGANKTTRGLEVPLYPLGGWRLPLMPLPSPTTLAAQPLCI